MFTRLMPAALALLLMAAAPFVPPPFVPVGDAIPMHPRDDLRADTHPRLGTPFAPRAREQTASINFGLDGPLWLTVVVPRSGVAPDKTAAFTLAGTNAPPRTMLDLLTRWAKS
jgi:hypothetical protein